LLLFSLGLSIDPFAPAVAGRVEEPSAESASYSRASLAAISDSATDGANSSWLAISSRPQAADIAHVGNAEFGNAVRIASTHSSPDLLTTLAFAQLGKRHSGSHFNAPSKQASGNQSSVVASSAGLAHRPALPPSPAWSSFAHDAQHTALSDVP